ncbi:MAG: tRNA (adenosine(37)-N6)-dimethylallyltransferase MiaA, partial [Kiritimatiellae bacterium]|nr:tRNA (adenosine(37)-N6)-dimethylallyltransferase MiaA [Kiritimatiellia bacterium]
FAEGRLVREVEALLAAHPGFERSTAGAGIGYAEALAFMRGEIAEEEAIARTCARTRQLAKKQRTWWRHQAAVAWVQGPAGAADVPRAAGAVLETWREHGPSPVVL